MKKSAIATITFATGALTLLSCLDLGSSNPDEPELLPGDITGYWICDSVALEAYNLTTYAQTNRSAAVPDSIFDSLSGRVVESVLGFHGDTLTSAFYRHGDTTYMESRYTLSGSDNSYYSFLPIDLPSSYSQIESGTMPMYSMNGDQLVATVAVYESNQMGTFTLYFSHLPGAYPPPSWPGSGVSALAKRAAMIPQSQCVTRECECKDSTIIDHFLHAQKESLKAWDAMDRDMANRPKNMQEARDRYNATQTADQTLLAEYRTCPTANPGAVIKLGGLDAQGNAVFDDCFCNTFCSIIVNSVVVHEKRHHQYYMQTLADHFEIKVMMMIPGLSSGVLAALLIKSESDAHAVQVAYLESETESKLYNDPVLHCTWTPTFPAGVPKLLARQAQGIPIGTRIGMLAKRIAGAL